MGVPGRREPEDPGRGPEDPEHRRHLGGLEVGEAGEVGVLSLRTGEGAPCPGEPRVWTASISSTVVATWYALALLAKLRALQSTWLPPLTPEARSLALVRRESRRERGGERGERLAPCGGDAPSAAAPKAAPLVAVSEAPVSFVSVRAVRSI